MSYSKYSRSYIKKVMENPLPKLEEDERIYLNVPYMAKDFAQACNCGFDRQRKLWFAGCRNSHIKVLVDFYGINESTSSKARELLKERLEEL